jgi:Flp pilus assembly protein TadD
MSEYFSVPPVPFLNRSMAIPPDMLEQARRFHQAGKLAEAERAYQQILQANGHDAEVWYQLGDAVLGQGRRAEAAERFRQALELQPDHVAEAPDSWGSAS